MRRKYTKPAPPTAWLNEQIAATEALLKFCEEHKYGDARMSHLRACLAALEEKRIYAALAEFQKIPLGGNGCFNDWWPEPVFEHETDKYLQAVLLALVERWSRLMCLSEKVAGDA